ncbi:hypothetical protein SRRS_00910 [Sporomusa rhizae]
MVEMWTRSILCAVGKENMSQDYFFVIASNERRCDANEGDLS